MKKALSRYNPISTFWRVIMSFTPNFLIRNTFVFSKRSYCRPPTKFSWASVSHSVHVGGGCVGISGSMSFSGGEYVRGGTRGTWDTTACGWQITHPTSMLSYLFNVTWMINHLIPRKIVYKIMEIYPKIRDFGKFVFSLWELQQHSIGKISTQISGMGIDLLPLSDKITFQ